MRWESLRRFWMYDDTSSLGGRILMRGVEAGLREHGKDVRVFAMNRMDPDVTAKMRDDLLAYQPDALFLANHPLSHLLEQIGLSETGGIALVWLFDDPALMGEHPFGWRDIALAADPAFIAGARARGARNVLFVPAASPCDPAPEPTGELRYPLLYAGSVFTNTALRKRIPPAIGQQFGRVIRHKLEHPGKPFADIFHSLNIIDTMGIRMEGIKEMNVRLNPAMHYFLYCEANCANRVRYAKALSHLGLHLFGNAAWRPYIERTPLIHRFHKPVDPFESYPRLARSAAVNINLPSLQGFSAPTLRDLQLPALGCFTLTGSPFPRRADWSDADPRGRFKLGDFPWPPLAETPGKLAEAAERWLADEKGRREWIAAARGEIGRHHTIARRLQQIADLLGEIGANADKPDPSSAGSRPVEAP